MEELVKAITALVSEEYQRAAAEHGGAAHTPHEGYALTKEEVDEAREFRISSPDGPEGTPTAARWL